MAEGELATTLSALEKSVRANAILDCSIACLTEAQIAFREGRPQAGHALMTMGSRLRDVGPLAPAEAA